MKLSEYRDSPTIGRDPATLMNVKRIGLIVCATTQLAMP